MNVLDFQKKHQQKQKISMITCYDYWSAKIISDTAIDCILVGDSLAMVMHGHDSTINADIQMMSLHTAAVRRGASKKFIVTDMPFLSYRKGVTEAMNGVEQLMKAGANSIKLEGVYGHQEVVKHITESGVPVMGHLGLTPQSIHQLGGFKVQGKQDGAAEWFVDQAKRLEDAGCFSVVLECIDAKVATMVSESINIPTIGIGAGVNVGGQVLVLQDMLGMDPVFNPTFLKKYYNGYEGIKVAIDDYDREVKEGLFPTEKESY